MNNIFRGAPSYADDITLICPSICGINNKIDICCEYAKEYDITYNPTKTLGIKYVDKVELNEYVVMNGNIIEWADNVRHLGNFVVVTLSDSVDCRYKRSMFNGYVNKFISKFGHLQPKVLLNLFNTYCCPFYGSCCCLPTPMTLASGGSPMFPLVIHQPASPSIWPAVQSLRRGLSSNPGATMWCVCGCS